MHWSEEKPIESLTSRSAANGGSCPFLNVVAASENGVVVESQRGFDIGSMIAIGFHVTGDSSRNSSFISADSMVVDSHPGVSRSGSPVFRITLMFSNISAEDRSLLVKLSESQAVVEKPKVPAFSLN